MAAKSPGKFLVSAHFWPLFNTSGLRSMDLDPGNVWEICLKNSKTSNTTPKILILILQVGPAQVPSAPPQYFSTLIIYEKNNIYA